MRGIDNLSINTLRFLAVDAVEAAKSGHPGMPLGAAPMAYILWYQFLKHNPRNPYWFNRDRFILSAGHGSALLYGLLHLFGYDLPLKEIKNFRQWGSKTPGHPEYGLTAGVETTTGPLGQGFANGVGMAMAEKFLAQKFNRDGFPVVDHTTYAIVSDGDLMEGVASEAASLAGTWKLGKLIYLYDDNKITIDGSADLAFTEDVAKRFEAYRWHVERVEDGNDLDAIDSAICSAQTESEKPSLIMVRTHIGYGSPKQDTASAHGEPLGPEATIATKEALGWPLAPPFHVPDEALAQCRQSRDKGIAVEQAWEDLLSEYGKRHSELAQQFSVAVSGELPSNWDESIPTFSEEDGPLATRAASGKVLNAIASRAGNLVGGSADLAPSNKTIQEGETFFGVDGDWGPNVHFGVREHAMASIANGLALHGGILPYVGTFLVFADYMRPAIRLAVLMQTKVIFIFTHDSIGVGEDGPTHQPIEHVSALRTIPGLTVLRPADANETAEAWKIAVQHDGPVVLILTRQKLPVLATTDNTNGGVALGAYLLSGDENGEAQVVLIATGSEVYLTVEAQQELAQAGVKASVVSMPSWELFESQPEEYREAVLPADLPKLVVEAGTPHGWHKYAGADGEVMGIERFGASAPGSVVFEKLGITVEQVVSRAMKLVKRQEV